MSFTGVIVGLLNCLLVAVLLVLVGAVIAWVAAQFDWPIPWNIQRIYLLVCLLVFIICAVSAVLGMPMVHIIGSRHYGVNDGSVLAGPLVANPPILTAGACRYDGAGCRAAGTPRWSPGDQACMVNQSAPFAVRCDLMDAYDGGKLVPPRPRPHVYVTRRP